MGKFMAGAGAVIGFIAVLFGIYALIAWGVSVLIVFVTGYDLGFWRTLAGMVLLHIVSNIAFAGMRVNATKSD